MDVLGEVYVVFRVCTCFHENDDREILKIFETKKSAESWIIENKDDYMIGISLEIEKHEVYS